MIVPFVPIKTPTKNTNRVLFIHIYTKFFTLLKLTRSHILRVTIISHFFLLTKRSDLSMYFYTFELFIIELYNMIEIYRKYLYVTTSRGIVLSIKRQINMCLIYLNFTEYCLQVCFARN